MGLASLTLEHTCVQDNWSLEILWLRCSLFNQQLLLYKYEQTKKQQINNAKWCFFVKNFELLNYFERGIEIEIHSISSFSLIEIELPIKVKVKWKEKSASKKVWCCNFAGTMDQEMDRVISQIVVTLAGTFISPLSGHCEAAQCNIVQRIIIWKFPFPP